MLFITPDMTCERCGSDNLVVETAEVVEFPYSHNVDRIKCCNCGEILLTEHEDTIEDYLSEQQSLVEAYLVEHPLPTYFYQCLFGELVKICGTSLTNPEQIYFDEYEDYTYEQLVACFLTNYCCTEGWHLALKETCAQCNTEWLIRDYEKFDLLFSDIFDGYIADRLISVIFDDTAHNDYYFYKIGEQYEDDYI